MIDSPLSLVPPLTTEEERERLASASGAAQAGGGAMRSADAGTPSDGSAVAGPNTPFAGPIRGLGGGTYPQSSDSMLTPSGAET